MKLSTLVAVGAAAVAGYLVAPSIVTASSPPTTIEPVRTPDTGTDCLTIPPNAPPIRVCPPSSTPGAPPPVETTTAGSTTTSSLVVEPALPQDQPGAIRNPHVSGYTIPATQLIPPVSITAPTKGCGA